MAQLARRITLSAANNIEIERGIVLPPGSYDGIERQAGLEMVDRTRWSEPEYKIEITADQFARMGANNAGQLLSIEYDVTKFVRWGQLTVTRPMH
jgi:hypothetical protein